MTSHPPDHAAQSTFMAPDDKAFRREQKRKRAPKPDLPSVPDGPCCFRCENWRAPGKDDDFGVCTALAVVAEKVKFGAERGTVVSIEWAMQQADVPCDHLRTKAYMDGCSRYAERREAA